MKVHGLYLKERFCICNELVLVEESIAEEFTAKVVRRVKEITYGDPLTDVAKGPSVTGVGLARIDSLVRDSIDQGAKLEVGGKRLATPSSGNTSPLAVG